MNNDFKQIVVALKEEVLAFKSAQAKKDFETMVRAAATIAGLAGTMRAIVEYSDEEIQNANALDQADQIMERIVFPGIISAR